MGVRADPPPSDSVGACGTCPRAPTDRPSTGRCTLEDRFGTPKLSINDPFSGHPVRSLAKLLERIISDIDILWATTTPDGLLELATKPGRDYDDDREYRQLSEQANAMRNEQAERYGRTLSEIQRAIDLSFNLAQHLQWGMANAGQFETDLRRTLLQAWDDVQGHQVVVQFPHLHRTHDGLMSCSQALAAVALRPEVIAPSSKADIATQPPSEAGGTTAALSPLRQRQVDAAMVYIRKCGPVKGVLVARHLNIQESTFRTHLVPLLKARGVVNNDDGEGYFLRVM